MDASQAAQPLTTATDSGKLLLLSLLLSRLTIFQAAATAPDTASEVPCTSERRHVPAERADPSTSLEPKDDSEVIVMYRATTDDTNINKSSVKKRRIGATELSDFFTKENVASPSPAKRVKHATANRPIAKGRKSMPALKARAATASTSASRSTNITPEFASVFGSILDSGTTAPASSSAGPSRAPTSTAAVNTADDDPYLSKPYQPGFTLASMMHEQAMESVSQAINTLEQMKDKLNFLLEFDSKPFGARYKRVDDEQ